MLHTRLLHTSSHRIASNREVNGFFIVLLELVYMKTTLSHTTFFKEKVEKNATENAVD